MRARNVQHHLRGFLRVAGDDRKRRRKTLAESRWVIYRLKLRLGRRSGRPLLGLVKPAFQSAPRYTLGKYAWALWSKSRQVWQRAAYLGRLPARLTIIPIDVRISPPRNTGPASQPG